jgi:hypothetical protein
LYAAEKEASNAAEKAERKMQLKEKVQLRYLCFPPGATQFQCKVAENFTMLLTSRARLHELAEAERGVGEAGEEVGGDTELQGVAEKMTSNRQIASAGRSMQEMEYEFV